MALGSTQPLKEMRRPVRRADNLTTFKCRLSRNLGASTSWKPVGLSRLYLYGSHHYLLKYTKIYITNSVDVLYKNCWVQFVKIVEYNFQTSTSFLFPICGKQPLVIIPVRSSHTPTVYCSSWWLINLYKNNKQVRRRCSISNMRTLRCLERSGSDNPVI
jgi:hypothetical protein